MELKVNNNTMDLSADAKASVDYQIFSDDASNIVSTVSSLNLPATEKNISGIDTKNRQSAELVSQYGTPFFGEIGVNKQRYNSLESGLNITLYDKLKTSFDKMKDDTLDLVGMTAGNSFDWDFSGNIPRVPNQYQWFFTTADFNGSSNKGQDYGMMSIYPAKVTSPINQLLLTCRLDTFIDRVFSYYEIDSDINSIDEVFNGTSFSELYIYIPVKQYAVELNSLYLRWLNRGFGNAKWGVYDSDDAVIESNQYVDFVCNNKSAYGIEQDKIMVDSVYPLLPTYAREITGTADTIYKLTFQGDLEITTDWKAFRPYNDFDGTQGSVDLVLEVIQNGGVIGTLILEEDLQFSESIQYYDSQGNPQFTRENLTNRVYDLTTYDFEIEFEFKASGSLQLRPNYKFNFYYFNDIRNTHYGSGVNDTIQTAMGTLDGLEAFEVFQYTRPDLEVGIATNDIPKLNMFPLEAITPLRREYLYEVSKYQYTHTDKIDFNETLKLTEVKISTVMESIVKRFNLGFWYNSNGDLKLSNWNNRYNPKVIVNMYESSGEPYEIDYVTGRVDEFSYSNENGEISSLDITGVEDYSLGDVYQQEINDDGKAVNIDTLGAAATPFVFGDSLDAEDATSLLETINDFALWGLSNNEQLSPDDIPIMIGYISSSSVTILPRLNQIQAFDTGEDGNSSFTPKNIYMPNGAKFHSDVERFTSCNMYLPQTTKANGSGTLLLGNKDGEIDISTELYSNFKYMLDDDTDTITVEGLLSHSEKSSILDGAMVRIFGLDDSNAIFKVLSIDGFMFDQEKSVVKLSIKKYVSNV
jgi:hypothetical protein